jgi:acetoin utilization deacetylase AcuC-like enzyme
MRLASDAMRAFAHDVFTYPLPVGHRFPLPKYRMVREAAEALAGLEVRETEAAGWDDIRRAHSDDWVERVRTGRLERREELALGLPWSPELVERARRATGATIQAARAALEDGVAANLGGGTHHAFADVGRGFCVFNDVVTALRVLRSEGAIGRVLVVDVDVHQGDGTHALLAGDASAFTLSVNGFRNYPFRRVPGDIDVDLPDGTGDERYLGELESALAIALRRARAGLCFVLAGADPFEGDRLGRLALTKAGLVARDTLVRDTLAAAGVPICVTLAGGYAKDIRDTVEINVNTLRVFTRFPEMPEPPGHERV